MHLHFLLESSWHVPRIVDVVIGNVLQFRAPCADILALRIEFLRLCQGVEHKYPTRADAGGASPSSIVRLDVVIEEILLKVVRSEPPVLLQVHREVARDDHTASIRHEASLIQVTNESIDKRHACRASLPSIDRLRSRLPIVIGPVVDSVAGEDLVTVIHTPELIEISPEELIDENTS